MKTSAGVLRLLGVMALVFVVAATGGCKHKKPKTISPETTETRKTTTETGTKEGLPGLDAQLDKLLWSKATGLQTVYFDYNSFALRPDTLKMLGENADKVKEAFKLSPDVLIQIEGHCDERGTQEYNLTLGEKRALAVREHLIKLGIAGDRLLTISYGKERPVATGHDEGAWKQNRRAEFNKSSGK